MTARNQLVRDVLFFIKNDLINNITDPVTRTGTSTFVMTSYPQRKVQYPLITIKLVNAEAFSSGMQSTMQDITLNIEVRIWARNESEKDTIYTEILDRLANIQHTSSTGSIANNLHDYNLLSSVEVDEEGEGGIKSRILQVEYKFFDLN